MKKLRDYQIEAIQECWDELKKSNDPILLVASVGAGKSIIIADLLLTIEKAGKRALCLVNNAELVRSNHQTYVEYGGQASIYCAALGAKEDDQPIIFGTPQTVINGINKNEKISKVQFNLIVIDEAHNIDCFNSSSTFMRILRHYQQRYDKLRIMGATGTPFRFRGSEIVGDRYLFKKQVGNITTSQLIDKGYLIKPSFEINPDLILDFSNVKIKSNGQFDSKQLNQVIENSVRLTELICKQIIHVMTNQNRFGVFIFATTKQHAREIMTHLPPNESALILGETEQDDRTQILEKARAGKIRYLVNISIISVGVDVPAFDTIAYMRPTESLVLMIQTLGRALRLSPQTNKQNALIMDFAGNIERHKDWDDPILLDAVKQTEPKDEPYDIQCPACQTMNTQHARRCIGFENSKRCNYFFEFKECVSCGIKNDIAARICRNCNIEIIDPNSKLNLANKDNLLLVDVIQARYGISGGTNHFKIHCAYVCEHNGKRATIYESYAPTSEKAKRVFYGQFVKQHALKPSDWYPHIGIRSKMTEMLSNLKQAHQLGLAHFEDGYKIKKRYFLDMPQ